MQRLARPREILPVAGQVRAEQRVAEGGLLLGRECALPRREDVRGSTRSSQQHLRVRRLAGRDAGEQNGRATGQARRPLSPRPLAARVSAARSVAVADVTRRRGHGRRRRGWAWPDRARRRSAPRSLRRARRGRRAAGARPTRATRGAREPLRWSRSARPRPSERHANWPIRAVGTDADFVPSSDKAHHAPPPAATTARPPTIRKPRRDGGGWGSGPCGKGRSSMAQQVSQSRYPDQRDTTKAKHLNEAGEVTDAVGPGQRHRPSTCSRCSRPSSPAPATTSRTSRVTSAGRRSLVRVIVDADGGVDLDAVADGEPGGVRRAGRRRARRPPPSPARTCSRSARPGVDRPLTEPRHWRRAVGRLVQVRGAARRETVTGRVRRSRRRRRRARRRRQRSARSPGPSSGRGRVQVEFNRARRRRRGGLTWSASTSPRCAASSARRRSPSSTLHRRARDRAADRLQAHRALDAARPGRDRPQDRRGRSSGRRSSAPDGELDRGVRRHPDRLRPGRGDDRPAGDPAAAARRRARPDLRRVLRPRGRHRHRRHPGRRAGRRSAASCWSTSARSRRCCRSPSRCRARTTPTAPGCKCYVVGVTRGMRGPQVTVSRTHPNLVKKLFALEVPEIADGSVEIVAVAREAGHRSKIAVRTDVSRAERQGRLHRADGPAGAQRRRRTARREDRHHRLGRGPGHLRRQRAVAGARARRARWSTRRPRRCGSSCRTSSSRWRSAARGRTPGWRPG